VSFRTKENPNPWPTNFYHNNTRNFPSQIPKENRLFPEELLVICRRRDKARRYLLGGLDGSLGDLANLVDLDDRLDDTDGNGLPHVTDGETSEGRVLSKSLNTHGLGRLHLHYGGITGLDELGVLLNALTGTAVDLLDQLGELAGNVGSVAVKNGSVSVSDLSGMVHQDDLGVEGLGTLGGIVLGVTGNVTTTDLLDGDVLQDTG